MDGESSVSIRRGKKIVSFDYAIILEWRCTIDGSTCEGSYEMPEVSNSDAWEDWEIRVTHTKDTDSIKESLEHMIRSLACT
jgi:activator of HSP90 ATPase